MRLNTRFAVEKGDFAVLPLNDERTTTLTKSPNNTGNTVIVHKPETTLDNAPVYAALGSLFAIGFAASVMSALSLWLLLAFVQHNIPSCPEIPSDNSQKIKLLRLTGSAICAFTLTCSLGTVTSAFLQFYFSLKVFSVWSESKIRIVLYLRELSCCRALAHGALFASIPFFMLALIIHIHLLCLTENNLLVSVIITSVLSMGIFFCLAILIHGVYNRVKLRGKRAPDTNTYEGLLIRDGKLATLV